MPPIRERMRPLPAGDAAPHELLARPRPLEDPPFKAGLDDYCRVALATDRVRLGPPHRRIERPNIERVGRAAGDREGQPQWLDHVRRRRWGREFSAARRKRVAASPQT